MRIQKNMLPRIMLLPIVLPIVVMIRLGEVSEKMYDRLAFFIHKHFPLEN